MKEKNDIIFIEYILDSINAIKEFSKDFNKEKLISIRLNQSAIIREIEIIGEAVKNISENLKEKHHEIEWKDIAGTRDKMIHRYFGVDIDIIWNIIKRDLPDFERKIKIIKKELINSGV